MTARIRYPLVVYYYAGSPEYTAEIERLQRLDTAGRVQLVESSAPGIRARDAEGHTWVGMVALEAAYRAAWAGQVSL